MIIRAFVLVSLCLFGCEASKQPISEAPILDLSYNRSLFQYHPYQKSDSLVAIADAYDVPVDQIMAVNHLTKNQVIQEGRVLKIPQLVIEANKNNVVKQPSKAMLLKGWSAPVRVSHQTRRDEHGGWMLYPKVSANVRAVSKGRVLYVGKRNKDLGAQVILQHANNQSTMYALIGDIKVKKGQFVKQGQLIGMASLGKNMKPHVYFDRIKA
ncbi:MAG: peptidoglycan DD-metalloendopeptidase family protein [Gammaproteobacteria bacterium]|nr:peptidoglycan DD-metalloendopeptidase family protein [Gammaproteobacteria bacterium]